jgi:uncharacterized membrane protein YraQ (UPF0718 family)
MKKEWGIFLGLLTIFLIAYLLNFTDPKIQVAIMEAFYMLQWYARNHTLACVVPAMFIAGAIATFFSKEAVLRHLGPKANKVEAYGVASVSGTVLAVCSCSVLPMFAGIYRVGAGLGPAAAFLYSGPAINVMAIFLTARVLGVDLGIARIIGSVVFAVVIGLIMAAIFRKDEQEREVALMQLPDPPPSKRSLWQTALFLGAMIAFLVFADWANPSIPEELVASWVGGNSLLANFMASLIGAMWYFATLTEIPILEALIGLGMGRGPALALLLAGPALSLPSIAVIYSVIGFKKTFVFVFLTVIMSTPSWEWSSVGSLCDRNESRHRCFVA